MLIYCPDRHHLRIGLVLLMEYHSPDSGVEAEQKVRSIKRNVAKIEVLTEIDFYLKFVKKCILYLFFTYVISTILS
jgi:hypothetical protein